MTNNPRLNATSPVNVPLLDINRSQAAIQQEILNAISDVCLSGRFIGGPACTEFEQSIAKICKAEHAIGCASGSDALLLAMMAVGVKAGDEVIVPSFTFFATASCVARLGATPVFVDIEPSSFNLDPWQLESAITDRTKAVIPVHLFGQCANMHLVVQLADRFGLYVIEDACQSLGSAYNGQPAGSMGHIGCFSFYPTKNLGGMGDGGMLTTNDAFLADRLKLLANHGMQPRYFHQAIGINSRLDALQAAVLNVKCKYLATWNGQRQAIARRYDNLFRAAGLEPLLKLPETDSNADHVWNQYTVRIGGGQRDRVRQDLSQRGVGTEIYYPIPLHLQGCFRYLGYRQGSLPETEAACGEVLSLPNFPGLAEAEQQQVVHAISEVMLAEVRPYRMAS